MKHSIEYNLPEEAEALDLALKSVDLYTTILQIDNHCAHVMDSSNPTPEMIQLIELIREYCGEVIY